MTDDAVAQFRKAWQTLPEAQREAMRREMYGKLERYNDELRQQLSDTGAACLQGDDAGFSAHHYPPLQPDEPDDHNVSPDCWCHPDEVEPGVFVHREAVRQ